MPAGTVGSAVGLYAAQHQQIGGNHNSFIISKLYNAYTCFDRFDFSLINPDLIYTAGVFLNDQSFGLQMYMNVINNLYIFINGDLFSCRVSVMAWPRQSTAPAVSSALAAGVTRAESS